MAVYTRVSNEDLQKLAVEYGMASIREARAIAEGVENTNYLLSVESTPGTDTTPAILTLFEKRVREEELPFFMGLTEHLADAGIPCPRPLRDTSGRNITQVAGRPAAVVEFLQGRSIEPPGLAQIKQAGTMLARMHLAAQGFRMSRRNTVSLPDWEVLYSLIMKRRESADASMLELIEHELTYQREHWPHDLPQGVIHADFFPNNVFFDKAGTLCGVIDFYFACNDLLAYDLAIVANAWCAHANGALDTHYTAALLESYNALRPLTAPERAAMPVLLRAAALRFLLTRLHDVLYHEEGALVTPHDPQEYARLLRFHVRSAMQLEDFL